MTSIHAYEIFSFAVLIRFSFSKYLKLKIITSNEVQRFVFGPRSDITYNKPFLVSLVHETVNIEIKLAQFCFIRHVYTNNIG